MRGLLPLVSGFLAVAAVLSAQQGAGRGQAGAGAPATGAQAAPAGNAENGKKLFASDGCYECHGYAAQGGPAGARLAPRPISWAALSKYVRHPTNQMPPFTAKVVPDQDLADIYAYLASIPPPPAVKSIPELNNP